MPEPISTEPDGVLTFQILEGAGQLGGDILACSRGYTYTMKVRLLRINQ